MKIENIYPTPIGEYEFENFKELNEGLVNFIYEMRNSDTNNTNQYSMAGPHGYHTNFELIESDNKFVREFHKKITEQIIKYYSHIMEGHVMGDNTRLVSWGMIYGPGDYSKVHTHPKADISTTYYVKVPNNMLDDQTDSNTIPGSFYHLDPRPACRWDINFADNTEMPTTAKEGTGYIFPGWLEHYVTPHYVKGDRICISTNIFADHKDRI
jgi:uncharacterized protein (TIGR02466 family)